MAQAMAFVHSTNAINPSHFEINLSVNGILGHTSEGPLELKHEIEVEKC
jgi:hypothetical protein